jgi:hypothetical protein
LTINNFALKGCRKPASMYLWLEVSLEFSVEGIKVKLNQKKKKEFVSRIYKELLQRNH